MEIQEILDTWDVLQREMGNKILGRTLRDLGWSFDFDRAKKRLGNTRMRDKIITLSRILVDNGMPRDQIEDTLRHEIAHAVDYEKRGTSAHDSTWKALAVKCGANPKRTGHLSKDVLPEHKWHRYCPNCKKVVGRYHRKPTSSRYVCKTCRGKLEVRRGPGHD